MVETVSLGFPLARLDKKRNRLEILAPVNEYQGREGAVGFLPPQYIPVSGFDDLQALADLLVPYSSIQEPYGRASAALHLITTGQGDPARLAQLALYPNVAESEDDNGWLRAMRAQSSASGIIPARP